MEVVPVSLSDPFKYSFVAPSTMQLLQFLPIMGFIALLMTAVWRQSKKFQVKTIDNLNKVNK